MLDDRASTAMQPHMTRDERVRIEGLEAARQGFTTGDNPYRSGSADGIAWRQGFDQCSNSRIAVEG